MRLLLFVLLCLSCAGCSPSQEEAARESAAKDVTAQDFGDDWPLTVDGGTLTCNEGAVMINVPGHGLFALNEKAQGPGTAVENLGELRKPKYNQEGVALDEKMSLEPLIEAGLDLCEKRD